MKTNTASIQGILSIAALVCMAVGFFNLFSTQVNDLLYHKVFYILIGASFFLQAPTLTNKKLLYPMYIAAALCVIGAFFPIESPFSIIKTIGLFAGVIISVLSRPRGR